MVWRRNAIFRASRMLFITQHAFQSVAVNRFADLAVIESYACFGVMFVFFQTRFRFFRIEISYLYMC